MRLVSWNVNGLRSVVRRDFDAWLSETNYDVVCLQEVKVAEDLLTTHWFVNYKAFWNPSRRPGHSGVATLVRDDHIASGVRAGMGDPQSDDEGRVLTIDVAGLRIVNIYAPHSHRKLLRLDVKVEFLAALKRFIEREKVDGVPLVLVGDFNIAHQEIDLANPKANRRNAGFLPMERQWITDLLNTGFVDAFRHFEVAGGHYTWWSMRKGVRSRNIGWRLDYIFVEKLLVRYLIGCHHRPEKTGSDHCPVAVELLAQRASQTSSTPIARLGGPRLTCWSSAMGQSPASPCAGRDEPRAKRGSLGAATLPRLQERRLAPIARGAEPLWCPSPHPGKMQPMADPLVPHFANDPGAEKIYIGVREFQCMGARPPHDHPHVYLDMGADSQILCPYCSTLYVFTARLEAGETEPGGCLVEDAAV